MLAFGIAAALLLASAPLARVGFVAAALVTTLAAERWATGWLLVAVLLPTVIHVYCFTGLFILHPAAGAYAVSPRTAALAEQFGPVIDQLTALSGAPRNWDGLAAIGRFLAFAYTYHYLNWFSKTGFIRWHVMGSRRLVAILLLYVGSVALYGYDYHVGLVALFLLSLIHVLLEFPLDLRTMAGLLAGLRSSLAR